MPDPYIEPLRQGIIPNETQQPLGPDLRSRHSPVHRSGPIAAEAWHVANGSITSCIQRNAALLLQRLHQSKQLLRLLLRIFRRLVMDGCTHQV